MERSSDIQENVHEIYNRHELQSEEISENPEVNQDS